MAVLCSLAFWCNAFGIPVAAGVLYRVFGILLSRIVTTLAMILSSVSVIANALRLRRMRLDPAKLSGSGI